jgi:AraC-like DNA-binding protein
MVQTSATVQPATFSTLELPQREQLEAWRGWFDGLFEVAAPADDKQGFAASTTQWALDGASFARVTAPAVRSERPTTLVRRNPLDHWVIGMGTSVSTRFAWHSSERLIPPYVPFVFSLGEAVCSEREADDRLHLYLQRDRFGVLAPLLDAARGAPPEGGMGEMLRDYLLMLERHLPMVTEAQLPRLTEAIGAMIAACIAPSPDRLADAAGQLDIVRLERARQAIRRHLRSARLGPELLCRELGMSRSQLYRLFQQQGGVARTIQQYRLTAVYAALSDPLERRPVAAIAEDFGFYDASAFSRTFRNTFGAAPREVRAAGAEARRPRPRASGPSLIDCLRAY